MDSPETAPTNPQPQEPRRLLRTRDDRLLGGVCGGIARYFGVDAPDRLLLVNFGRDLHFNPAPEPLLAPPEGQSWKVLWSS